MFGRQGCCVHTCTVYTPIGDEGCPEGEPAVYTLIQCTPLLVMRDVWKARLLYTLVHVYTPIGDEGCPLCIRLYSVHSYW